MTLCKTKYSILSLGIICAGVLFEGVKGNTLLLSILKVDRQNSTITIVQFFQFENLFVLY